MSSVRDPHLEPVLDMIRKEILQPTELLKKYPIFEEDGDQLEKVYELVREVNEIAGYNAVPYPYVHTDDEYLTGKYYHLEDPDISIVYEDEVLDGSHMD
ncbi:MAG: hypothetical protein AAGG81_03295 [Chlamydiota bacterium]